jgi:hypothetical protein
MFGIINNSQTPNARVDILANGDVRIGGAAWSAGFASLAGISFKAER